MANQQQIFSVAVPAGFEPATFSLEGRRKTVSDQSTVRLFKSQELAI